MTRAEAKKLKFTYDELSCTKSEFITDFIKKICERFNVQQKDLDTIYQDLVYNWENQNQGA